jgi:hypothetical protein
LANRHLLVKVCIFGDGVAVLERKVVGLTSYDIRPGGRVDPVVIRLIKADEPITRVITRVRVVESRIGRAAVPI